MCIYIYFFIFTITCVARATVMRAYISMNLIFTGDRHFFILAKFLGKIASKIAR